MAPYAEGDVQVLYCKHYNVNDYDVLCIFEQLDNVNVFIRGILTNFGKGKLKLGPLTFPPSEHAYQFYA